MVQSNGTMVLSVDGHHLGSDVSGGHSAVLRVTSDEGYLLTIEAPTLTQSPPGFDAANLEAEVAFEGMGTATGISQAYSHSRSEIVLPDLTTPGDLTIDNRITTTTGLVPGVYQTQTVVTCS